MPTCPIDPRKRCKAYHRRGGRRNATFGGVTRRETDAQSFYNALQAGVTQTTPVACARKLSYTFSRSMTNRAALTPDFDNHPNIRLIL